MHLQPSPAIYWKPRPDQLKMSEDAVHVWKAELDTSAEVRQCLAESLSAEEQARANRFVFSRDRNHFAVGRGILREILGWYLGRPPGDIPLTTGPGGKPRLEPDRQTGEPPIMFNLSHTSGLALLALNLVEEVGVDVEKLRSEFATQEIAERYFSAPERAELRALPAELHTEAFFLCWTRKEAYLKARGEGLRIPLDSFSVSLTPGLPEILSSADAALWHLASFYPAPEYVAALVTAGRKRECQFWQWQGSV